MQDQLYGTFTVDEEINQASTGGGKVVEWDHTNRILYYIQTRHNDLGVDANERYQTAFSDANVITGQGGGALQELRSCNNWHGKQCFVYFRLFRKLSKIAILVMCPLYENRDFTIQRATDQTENIKLVIEF